MVQISVYPAHRAVSIRDLPHSDSRVPARAGIRSPSTAAAVQIDLTAIDEIVCSAASRLENIRASKIAGISIRWDQGS